jgi:hypothetical protein
MLLFYNQSYTSDSNTVGYNVDHPTLRALSKNLDALIRLLPRSAPLVAHGMSIDLNQITKDVFNQVKTDVLTRLCNRLNELLATNSSPEIIMDVLQQDTKNFILDLSLNLPLIFEGTASEAQTDIILGNLYTSIQACEKEAETYIINLQTDFTSNVPRMV